MSILNGCAAGLALKERLSSTRRWAIGPSVIKENNFIFVLFFSLFSYNKSCVTLVPELNNNFLNFSPIWNQRVNETTDILDESLTGPSLQSGTKLGLFSYLFDRWIKQNLFDYIRYSCCASRMILILIACMYFCYFRHAMSQAFVRYFLYTFRYITTAQELFTFIREKCSASLR